ncbi:hypothetical protein M5D96_007735, partial [Drosophila gunungcola]
KKENHWHTYTYPVLWVNARGRHLSLPPHYVGLNGQRLQSWPTICVCACELRLT